MRRFAVGLIALAAAACGAPDDDAEKPEAPVVPAAITYDGAGSADRAALLAHGDRMATVLGCRGCHGNNLQGRNVSEQDPKFGDMNAPNLTLLMAQYSDQELDRVVRRGVPKDGREFWFMPSESFQYVSDADLAALVAYLRTLKPAGEQLPPIRKGPAFDEQVKSGLFTNAKGMIERFQASKPTDLGEGHALGRYIAMTACTECHNSELQGYEGFTPNLDIAGAYSSAELEHLLRTGEGKAKKDLGLMSMQARTRFAKLTDRELKAIVGYVKARADRPQ